MNDFAHDTLDRSILSLRLIKIEKLDDTGRPVCQIRNSFIGEHTYYALSYTWGLTDCRPIIVNGRRAFVGTNLEAFLQKACTTLQGVWLWIDALCINQEDVEERNHQVSNMGLIYSNATKVIAWLGKRPNEIHAFFWRLSQSEEVIMRQTLSDSESMALSIIELDRNPYWNRMWIVQELQLARKVQLVYDDEDISWGSFWLGIDAVKRSLKGFAGVLVPTDKLESLVMHKHKRVKNQRPSPFYPLSLADLLRTFAGLQCRNRLDRVFALLALCDSNGFKVNYRDTLSELALRTWLHVRTKGDGFISPSQL